MRSLSASLLVIAFAASAQSDPSVSELTSILVKLHDSRVSRAAVNRQFAKRLMSLDGKSSGVPAADLADFTAEFTEALAGRPFTGSQLTPAVSAVVDAMHNSGMGTMAFRELPDRFAKTLVAISVPPARARSIASRLDTIGKRVRGPDDLPLRALNK